MTPAARCRACPEIQILHYHYSWSDKHSESHICVKQLVQEMLGLRLGELFRSIACNFLVFILSNFWADGGYLRESLLPRDYTQKKINLLFSQKKLQTYLLFL
jgi:hypothetical protein